MFDALAESIPDRLLDAVYIGLDTMRQARYERKTLLIVSDGGENHSRYNVKEVWPVLMEAGVQIYAMGIFDEAPRTKAERMGPDLLATIKLRSRVAGFSRSTVSRKSGARQLSFPSSGAIST